MTLFTLLIILQTVPIVVILVAVLTIGRADDGFDEGDRDKEIKNENTLS